MEIQDLRAELSRTYRAMAIGRKDLNEWEKGYVTAVNETLKKIARKQPSLVAVERNEKKLWDCAKSCFVMLMADKKNHKKIEACAALSYHAARIFSSTFETLYNDGLDIKADSDD